MRKTIIPATKYLYSPRITYPENMPQTGPCFIYGNHANYFDPFLMNVGMLQEPTAGVMTRDQFHKSIPRIFMDSIGIVPTSKYVPEPGIIRSVMRMIDQKRMIVIFPEGGRRWDGKRKSLIETTLKLFWKMKIPVHPVQIHGSYLGWPRWADNYRKSSIEVRYMNPLHVSDFNTYEEFADRCRLLIDFNEYYPPSEAMPVKGKKPAAGIERFLYRCPETGVNGAVYSPDGERVFSRSSPMHYRLNTASRLIDRSGKEHSLISLFEKINQMPIESIQNDLILEKAGTKLSKVDEEHQLHTLGRSYAELHTGYMRIACGSELYELPLEEIRYTSIEQNHKLTITTSGLTLQLNLAGQSALQWQRYIRRLQQGEKPVKKL